MGRGLFYYLMVPLLALGALLQSSAGNRIAYGHIKPDLVLLLLVAGTLIYGVRVGLWWAFVGGLFLDLFSGGPLGSSSVALMAAAVVAGLGHSTLSRFNLFVPLTAMALGTLSYGLVYVGVLQLLDSLAALWALTIFRHQLPFLSTIQEVVVPAIVYNTLLMLLLLPLLNRVPETPETVSLV